MPRQIELDLHFCCCNLIESKNPNMEEVAISVGNNIYLMMTAFINLMGKRDYHCASL